MKDYQVDMKNNKKLKELVADCRIVFSISSSNTLMSVSGGYKRTCMYLALTIRMRKQQNLRQVGMITC